MNGYNGFKKNFIMKKIKIGEFMTEQIYKQPWEHIMAADAKLQMAA